MVLPLYTTGAINSYENLIYALFIGIMFGFILERAGFATARHIAPVFYFKDLRVSQTMVSAILTTATLITISVYFGYLDFNQIFISNTYLWPYVIGGFLFGIGMVMSGWCPGTAVVGFATGKVDAFVFLIGLMAGMFFYFEIYDMFEGFANFANSSFVGRFTFENLLGVDIYTSLIITILIGIGLSIFMHTMKNLQGDK